MKKGDLVKISKMPFPESYAERKYRVHRVMGKYAFIHGLGWGLKKNLTLVRDRKQK